MPLSLERIQAYDVTVAIIGLGYIGLPQSLIFSEAGFSVIGFDTDREKVESINAGESYFHHIPSTRIAPLVDKGKLRASEDFTLIAQCDAVLICVPTPLNAQKEPDLSALELTCQTIAPHLKSPTLVILESTTWPGTTQDFVRPLLEEGSSLRLGQGLHLCYSPEREDPGNQDFCGQTTPRLIGGLDKESLKLGEALYKAAIETVIPTSSTQVAESAKLLENVFRCVNIALVNEMKILFDKLNIDIWEVIQAASTKPFGFMPFYPGPGLGGHCIPIDPYYLLWKAKRHGIDAPFIELAGEINRSMPSWVVNKVQDLLKDRNKPLKGSKILILGLAYKPNIDDLRESPSCEMLRLLEEEGAHVDYHDPLVPTVHTGHHHPPFLEGRCSKDLSPHYDCFVLATHHAIFSTDIILSHGVPVVDTRNLLPKHEQVQKA